MATLFSHALVGATCDKVANMPRRATEWAIVCSILPDVDVVGFRFGTRYGDFLGHRGFTHSLLFALLLSVLVVCTVFRSTERFCPEWWKLVVFFFVVTVSHGVLDALTNGGLGIAFFSPFRPLEVSPIGAAFFSRESWAVLANEALLIGLPCALLLAGCHAIRRRR